MPEALSFCLARAQRPLLHVDRNAHLQNDPNVLSFTPDQQLLRQASRGIHSSGLDGPDSGITPRLELVKDRNILYLGETCVFYLTLSNQGSSAASAVTVKVECSVEGGSNAVLHDNSQSPLPQLPATGRHDVIVQTDIKEEGVVSIVASAVYTDSYGERKYHVQFFKFQSASPLRVTTRVRCLPHIQQPARPVYHTNSSSTADRLSGTSASTSSSVLITSSSRTRPYCFLEVSVDNTTPLLMVLHAVKLLPSAGLVAQQLSISEQQAQQQPQQQQLEHTDLQQQQQVLPQSNHHHHHQQQQQQQGQAAAAKRVSDGSGKLEPAGDDRDTRLQHDIGKIHSTSCTAQPAGAAAGALQQQAQNLVLQDPQQQQQQPVQQQQAKLGPLLSGQPCLVVIPPGGGSHNYLWQIEQQSAHRSSSSDGVAAAVGPSSTSSAFLGRLDLHWSLTDGKTGRLLTQPLSRPISASAARDVLLQLVQLLPLPAATAAAGRPQQQQQALNTDLLQVGVPFRAVFSVAAAAGQQQQQAATGPLLVLYTEVTSSGSSSGAAIAASVSSKLVRTSDSSSNTHQQHQQQRTGLSVASRGALGAQQQSGVQQQQRLGSSGLDSGRGPPAVAVQGKRTQRVQRVLPGQSVEVEFVLLPLKRGWARLPKFVVVSEADGRLLDSVHDVQVLVV